MQDNGFTYSTCSSDNLLCWKVERFLLSHTLSQTRSSWVNNGQFDSLLENGKSVFVKESGFGDKDESMDQIVLCELQKERGDGLKMGSNPVYESANQAFSIPVARHGWVLSKVYETPSPSEQLPRLPHHTTHSSFLLLLTTEDRPFL